jgi:hypothetical protein
MAAVHDLVERPAPGIPDRRQRPVRRADAGIVVEDNCE